MAGEVARDRARKLRAMRQVSLPKHGKAMVRAINSSFKSASGGDRRLSGLGNKPLIGASAKFSQGSNSSSVIIAPSPKRAKGPARWLDSGTEAGQRGRLGVARARRQGPRRDGTAFKTAQRASYYHPGTKGKNAWSDPVKSEQDRIQRELRKEFGDISK